MPSPLAVRGHTLNWGARTYVMGILNITPDSFSGDGLLPASPSPSLPSPIFFENGGGQGGGPLDQALAFLAAGADILDVGGESTRPGAQPVSADEEMARVVPVIEAIRRNSDAIISVDTYKASVAEAALKAGADIVNDVWGLRADPSLAEVAARYAAPLVLMHNRSKTANAEIKARLGGRYVGMEYADLLADVERELLESVALARAAGVPGERIILDPGIGFGKTVEQNLALIDHLDKIKALGFPVLLGPSRKSFIGYTLDLPADQRLEGTAAGVAVGITRGADIVRVHDVLAMVRVARMTDALVRRTATP
jgi:dihydropteroate synthase